MIEKAHVAKKRIAPELQPELALTGRGRIKVRLRFQTKVPISYTSFMLKADYQAPPPYTEEVCILMLCSQVCNSLHCFTHPFFKLQESGVVPQDAQLRQFAFLDEDEQTLAYLV